MSVTRIPMTLSVHNGDVARTRFVLDALVSDPATRPETLHALACDSQHAWFTGPARLLAHPNAQDLDPQALMAAHPHPVTLLQDVLGSASTTATMRDAILACADPQDVWSVVGAGVTLTSHEIQRAHDTLAAAQGSDMTATQALADATALVRHPATPRHLVIEAIPTLFRRASIDFTATILTLLTAARRHDVDIAAVLAAAPKDTLGVSVRAELTSYLALASTHDDALVAYAQRCAGRGTARLLDPTWSQFITATHDPGVARAALQSAPRNIDAQATIVTSAHLREVAEEALRQYLGFPNPLTDADAEQLRRKRRAVQDGAWSLARRSGAGAVAVLRYAVGHTLPRERDSILRAALTSPAHTASSTADALSVLADSKVADDRDLYATLAANPRTAAHVRRHAVQRTRELTPPEGVNFADQLLSDLGASLEADPRSAGHLALDALTGHGSHARAMRGAALHAAHTHPSWPPAPDTAVALLTLAATHEGTLGELLDTAAAVTT